MRTQQCKVLPCVNRKRKRKKEEKNKEEKNKMTRESMKFNGESDLIARKKKYYYGGEKKLFCEIEGV